MKKTVVMIMLIAALALSLTGCGKAPAAQNTAPAEAQTPAQETTPAAERDNSRGGNARRAAERAD